MTTDGGLFGTPRQDGPRPKLVVIGIVWAGFGIVALITAVLMRSVGIAVFGVLCVLAGGGLYAGQRARERLEEDERSWRSDPGGLDDDLDEPEPDDEPVDDDGAPPDPDRDHATRVMSTGGHDDIVDAEYTEYVDYEPSPSEQDDGTGYDDEETAYQRRRQDEWERESRAREDDTQVMEADDHGDEGPADGGGPDGEGPHGGGPDEDRRGDHDDRDDRPRRDASR